jgi:hypothetical protein
VPPVVARSSTVAEPDGARRHCLAGEDLDSARG